MLGRWWQGLRASREAAALRRRAIPDDLWKRTLVRYPFLRRHSADDMAELRRLTSLFLDRKEFSATQGLRLTDMMAVTVAAQAVLPVLKLGLQRYDGFVGIVVHPGAVRAPRERSDDHGVVHAYEEELAGEAMQGGPLMLSWADVRQAGRSAAQGYNVVIHEFAHVLDMEDGAADGMPLLPPDLPAAEWAQVLKSEYDGFVARVQAEEETALDPYGAEAPDEFFAVASEAFFVAPLGLKAEHPALYGVFQRFYRQDPAAEPAAGG
jgi:Mlc titration factor MtfA (ptsG expression regulator)